MGCKTKHALEFLNINYSCQIRKGNLIKPAASKLVDTNVLDMF